MPWQTHSVEPLITDRLRRRVECDFPEPSGAAGVMHLLRESTDAIGEHWALAQSPEGVERLHAAMILGARGSIPRLQQAVALAALDWRDLLVGAGLGNEDWQTRLDEELGPVEAH